MLKRRVIANEVSCSMSCFEMSDWESRVNWRRRRRTEPRERSHARMGRVRRGGQKARGEL